MLAVQWLAYIVRASFEVVGNGRLSCLGWHPPTGTVMVLGERPDLERKREALFDYGIRERKILVVI